MCDWLWLVHCLVTEVGGCECEPEPVVIFHIYLGSVSHFWSYTLLIITIMIKLLNTNQLPHPKPGPAPGQSISKSQFYCETVQLLIRSALLFDWCLVLMRGGWSDVTSCHDILIYNTQNVSWVKHSDIKLWFVIQYNFILYGN